mmetsp:Transcript_36527/g.61084  ORF Transcript_36527/g.61084 Transcript_36527/m.61084 type:complete len:103 (-) Transcript_36527:199-507(-)
MGVFIGPVKIAACQSVYYSCVPEGACICSCQMSITAVASKALLSAGQWPSQSHFLPVATTGRNLFALTLLLAIHCTSSPPTQLLKLAAQLFYSCGIGLMQGD